MLSFWRRRAERRRFQSVLHLDVSIRSDVGCQRSTNQDAAVFVNSGGTDEIGAAGVLAVVADGMGGHLGGDTASRLAVEVVRKVYFGTRGAVPAALGTAFNSANQAIFELPGSDHTLTGMGTTCVALAIRAGQAFGAHVGDSRLYLVRGEAIRPLTEDHSLVMDLVRRGVITPEAARAHPDTNVILRALGTHPRIEVALWDEQFAVQADDRFVLSTDGLHGLVCDDEIRDVVVAADPAAATACLVDLAKSRGGHDNITVAVVALRASPSAACAPRDTQGD